MASITVGQTLSNSARTSKNQYDLIVSLKLNSQNIQNNTSNVTVTLQLKSNYAYFQQYACSGSLSLTGARTVLTPSPRPEPSPATEHTARARAACPCPA